MNKARKKLSKRQLVNLYFEKRLDGETREITFTVQRVVDEEFFKQISRLDLIEFIQRTLWQMIDQLKQEEKAIVKHYED